MTRNNSLLTALPKPTLSWDESGTPSSTRFGDVYYSRENGLEESRHTFLAGNGLPDRWRAHGQAVFCIAETGFGTGLNFLLTLQSWLAQPEPKPRLHYLSIEQFPLAREDLEKALSRWPSLADSAKELAANYPPALPGIHRLEFAGGRVLLDLHWGEALEVLTPLAESGHTRVDAWFLDGFSPATNAAMWQPELLRVTAALCGDGATLATFTSAGAVRRSLAAAGYDVHKAPGFGRKREALRGTMPRSTPPAAPQETPWDMPAHTPSAPPSAIVLGAGLAGTWTAHALARRGIGVSLLEQDAIASAGSGNEQGILYTRLSHRHGPLVDFGLHSYLYASRMYGTLIATGELRDGTDGSLCGNFHTLKDDGEREALAAALKDLADLAQIMEAGAASARLGVDIAHSTYWLPGSGWMHPEAVCRALIKRQDGINLQEDCGPVTLVRDGQQWLAIDAGNNTLASASCAVIATGTGTVALQQTQWLPLRAIRGQTTHIPVTPESERMTAALCHEGYIAPARMGRHCVGASFNLDNHEAAADPLDHRENLDKLAAAIPAWRVSLSALDHTQLDGRVGFRCASPDYLPAVGPVPDRDRFIEDYAALRDNGRQLIDRRGSYHEGLYVSAGHGSRGLTSTPVAGELLASIICGECPPLERHICRAVSPARFLIRDLVRNRI